MASLTPSAAWHPDADRAFARVMQRQSNNGRSRGLNFAMVGAALTSAGILMVMLPWHNSWTPSSDVPAKQAVPAETRQHQPVPAFAAEIPVVTANTMPTFSSSPVPVVVFKPIPPLPELPPTESGGEVLAQAAGGTQERPQTGVSQPIVTSQVQPEYTPEAREAKIQGTVELRCIVRTDGSVNVDQVVRGLGYGLDEAARDAVNQWKFVPGKRDGVPVNVVINILVNFALRK